MKKRVLFVAICAMMLLLAAPATAQKTVYKETLGKRLNLSRAMPSIQVMVPDIQKELQANGTEQDGLSKNKE